MPPDKKEVIQLSLTDFVDFVCKAGSSKLTKVRQIKSRERYSPATDFYKSLREGIVSLHEENRNKKDLKEILDALADNKKIKNYSLAIDGYRKFWGRKEIVFFKPPSKRWKTGDINMRINPELGLTFGGGRYVVKLYWKAIKLSKDRVEQILTLMRHQLDQPGSEVKMALLDVKNGKLFIKEDDDMSLLPLLEGELRSFEVIWKAL